MKFTSSVLASLNLIRLLEVVSPSEIGLPKATANCGQVTLKAEARTKYATTPGFPNPFPGDAKCVWAIYSAPGKRIRLEFQKFYLLPAVAGKCGYHYVIVKSPFTLFTMGPYCGETGLPTIVSTGNLIYVELHTIVPVTTDNYQGFKLAFKETVESSSYELRPDNSVEDEIATIDPDTMNMLSPTTPTTTTKRPTRSTTKPWRFRPSRRPLQNINRRPMIPRRTRPPPPASPPRQQPPNFAINKYPKKNTGIVRPTTKSHPLRIEIIVAIAVGGLIAVAIIVMIAYKMISRKKAKDGKNTGDAKDDKKTAKKDGKSDHHLPIPGIQPDLNQHHIFYDRSTGYPMFPDYIEDFPMEEHPPPYDAESQRRKKLQSKNHQRSRNERSKRKHRSRRR